MLLLKSVSCGLFTLSIVIVVDCIMFDLMQNKIDERFLPEVINQIKLSHICYSIRVKKMMESVSV